MYAPDVLAATVPLLAVESVIDTPDPPTTTAVLLLMVLSMMKSLPVMFAPGDVMVIVYTLFLVGTMNRSLPSGAIDADVPVPVMMVQNGFFESLLLLKNHTRTRMMNMMRAMTANPRAIHAIIET